MIEPILKIFSGKLIYKYTNLESQSLMYPGRYIKLGQGTPSDHESAVHHELGCVYLSVKKSCGLIQMLCKHL
jgi:hypothetical protein